jgi:PBP1b-binding outer membrane lipoprotein LpoB
MNKCIKLLISTISLAVILSSCSAVKGNTYSQNAQTTSPSQTVTLDNKYKYFAVPDKIIYFNKGKIKEFTKEASLFVNILDLTNKRFGEKIDMYKLAIQIESLNKLEQTELVLEFVYSDIKEIEYNMNSDMHKKYKRLLMPLSGEYSNCIFFDDGTELSAGPIATLSSATDIIQILK